MGPAPRHSTPGNMVLGTVHTEQEARCAAEPAWKLWRNEKIPAHTWNQNMIP